MSVRGAVWRRSFLLPLLFALAALPLAAAPSRVVSLSPSVTETIYQLGQGARLVGRSSACDYPEAAVKLPVAGGFGKPYLERLAALKPDYVVTTLLMEQSVRKTLEGLGVKVLVLPGKTLADYGTGVKALGDVLGCPEAAAKETERFERALSSFRAAAAKVPRDKRPKVYLEVWHRPPLTCGGQSFLNEMIECAGGVNIAAAEPRDYFTCSEEWVLKSDPDIVISPGMGISDGGRIKERRGWSQVAAVRDNRVYTGLDQGKVLRLGPRTVEGVAILKTCVDGGK